MCGACSRREGGLVFDSPALHAGIHRALVYKMVEEEISLWPINRKVLRLSDVLTRLDLIFSVRVVADTEGVCLFQTERRRLERLNVAETAAAAAAAALRLTADFCTVTDRQSGRQTDRQTNRQAVRQTGRQDCKTLLKSQVSTEHELGNHRCFVLCSRP